jgi:hypothetical protein
MQPEIKRGLSSMLHKGMNNRGHDVGAKKKKSEERGWKGKRGGRVKRLVKV